MNLKEGVLLLRHGNGLLAEPEHGDVCLSDEQTLGGKTLPACSEESSWASPWGRFAAAASRCLRFRTPSCCRMGLTHRAVTVSKTHQHIQCYNCSNLTCSFYQRCSFLKQKRDANTMKKPLSKFKCIYIETNLHSSRLQVLYTDGITVTQRARQSLAD